MSFKSTLLIEEIKRSNKLLLESSCDGLTTEQQKVVRNIYNEFLPLIEATLTPDQVKQLFTGVEQSATAAGTNRSGLGKAVDVAKLPVQAVQKVNDIINKAGQWAQNTKPVQAFDQKFEDLKKTISAKFPNLAQNLTQAGEWAKTNPGKTAVIIGVLTAIASLAGGPIGGAIAGQVLRGSAELMKGEKLSTAVGKGVKTAVLGYLTGSVAKELGSWLSGLRAEVVPFNDGLTKVSFSGSSKVSSGFMSWTRSMNVPPMVVLPEDKEYIQQLIRDIKSGQPGAFDELYNFGKEISSPEYRSTMAGITSAAKEYALQNDAAFQALEAARKTITAAAQGAVAASTGSNNKPTTTTEQQIYKIFEHITTAHNNSVDEIQRIQHLSGIHEGIFDKVKQFGTNLTTKVTADKLMKAWQAAGSPTDSDAVAEILRKAGVSDDIITSTYQSMNISAPTASQPSATTPAVSGGAISVAEINKALNSFRMRDLQSIQKTINTVLTKRTANPTTP